MTERRTLTNGRKPVRKHINMEEVYKMLDGGKSVTQAAKELGVCSSTLYRHHRAYQEELKAKLTQEELPPLPDDMV